MGSLVYRVLAVYVSKFGILPDFTEIGPLDPVALLGAHFKALRMQYMNSFCIFTHVCCDRLSN